MPSPIAQATWWGPKLEDGGPEIGNGPGEGCRPVEPQTRGKGRLFILLRRRTAAVGGLVCARPGPPVWSSSPRGPRRQGAVDASKPVLHPCLLLLPRPAVGRRTGLAHAVQHLPRRGADANHRAEGVCAQAAHVLEPGDGFVGLGQPRLQGPAAGAQRCQHPGHGLFVPLSQAILQKSARGTYVRVMGRLYMMIAIIAIFTPKCSNSTNTRKTHRQRKPP